MNIARAKTTNGVAYGLVDDGAFRPLTGDPFGEVTCSDHELGLDAVELLHPVEPSRVIVVLGGFFAEGRDTLREGAEPRLLPKVVTEHRGPNATIPKTAVLIGATEMEAELALVVGRRIHDVSPEAAWEAILGFTVYNDVTAAEYMAAKPDYYRAKSIDGFSIFGPWISTDITRDDLRDGLAITGRVNGQVVQSGSTARFKFDPGQILSHASRYFTLLPGDVISLGTPPPAYAIASGDRVQAEVENIGVLTNLAE
jgi:2-keto-4-pentenoate hydratase/2-oxohepta-3-ene-1,7-dioic acid hydratase in catechol pathway